MQVQHFVFISTWFFLELLKATFMIVNDFAVNSKYHHFFGYHSTTSWLVL